MEKPSFIKTEKRDDITCLVFGGRVALPMSLCVIIFVILVWVIVSVLIFGLVYEQWWSIIISSSLVIWGLCALTMYLVRTIRRVNRKDLGRG